LWSGPGATAGPSYRGLAAVHCFARRPKKSHHHHKQTAGIMNLNKPQKPAGAGALKWPRYVSFTGFKPFLF